MFRSIQIGIGVLLFIVGLPGFIDDISGWGTWLKDLSKWIEGQPMLAWLQSAGWSHYVLIFLGLALIIPWRTFQWFTPRNRKMGLEPSQQETPNLTEPDYEQWDKSESLTLWNAAHLWAEQEPVVDHPGGSHPFYEIFTNLKAAADSNVLPVHVGGGQYGHVDTPANRHTVAHRDDLRRFTREHRNERPKFLFPEWRLTRQQAIDSLGRKMEEFLDEHFNRQPQTPIDQEHWWGVFFTWRNREIRPLVERLNGEAAAVNFSTFVSFHPKIWEPNLGPRFNHIKTMMEITLHRIKQIIEDFKP